MPVLCTFLLAASASFVGKVDGVDEVQMIVTSADHVRPHVQTVTTYAADFDEIQTIELDADDVDEWQYAYTNVAETVYENQVNCLRCRLVYARLEVRRAHRIGCQFLLRYFRCVFGGI